MTKSVCLPVLLASVTAGLAQSPTNVPINLPFSMPDVNVAAAGNTAYAFCGSDDGPFYAGKEKWLMPRWRLFSSTDLVHWHFESLLDPASTYIGPSHLCFGGHGIQRGGKWFWYFSDYDRSIGVAVSDSPQGPWKDALGKPLIPEGLADTRPYDPCVFLDDDSRAYIVFGANKNQQLNYHIAELNADMISLKETPRKIVVNGNAQAQANLPVDASFLHKANGKYYLSWRRPYAVADSPYGPYAFLGNQDASGHGGFFQFRNQWFVNYTVLQPGYRQRYRFAALAYVHYRDDGSIAPMEETIRRHGVGEYDGNWPAIEAEWHMGTTATPVKKQIPSGFEMRNLRDGDYLRYPYIHNMPSNAAVVLKYSSAAAAGGRISIRADEPNGPELGAADIPSTGAWDKYDALPVQLNQNPPGTISLAFVFEGRPGAELMRLDSFSIAAAKRAGPAK